MRDSLLQPSPPLFLGQLHQPNLQLLPNQHLQMRLHQLPCRCLSLLSPVALGPLQLDLQLSKPHLAVPMRVNLLLCGCPLLWVLVGLRLLQPMLLLPVAHRPQPTLPLPTMDQPQLPDRCHGWGLYGSKGPASFPM